MNITNTINQNVFADNFLKEQYQDIVVNGEVIKPGARDCNRRYEALKPILNNYKRPITVLDLGASQGYFSLRIAHDYHKNGVTSVMVEGDYDDSWRITDQLLEICKLNTELDNIIFLRHRITPEDLERLASCEHFDVILAFNILHHFGKNWQRATDALLQLGDNIIIETPPSDDVFASKHENIRLIEQYLINKQGTVICETPRHTNPEVKGKMFLFEQTKTHLQRRHWLEKKLHNPFYPKFEITSNHEEKTVKKIDTNTTYPWHHGINLMTFKMLNGVYPEIATIEQEVNRIYDGKHTDFFPWNMIIQGNSLIAIDGDDTRWAFNNQTCLNFTLQMIQYQKPDELLKWFLKEWIPFIKLQTGAHAYVSWCIGT